MMGEFGKNCGYFQLVFVTPIGPLVPNSPATSYLLVRASYLLVRASYLLFLSCVIRTIYPYREFWAGESLGTIHRSQLLQCFKMTAECSTPLSVFFPVDCLSCENGILFGWKSNAPNEFLVVATVIRLNEIGAAGMNPQEWLNNLKEKPNIRYADSASAKLAFLGLWCVDDDYDTRKELAAVAGGLFESKSEEYILLRKKENSSTPALYCRGHLKELNALVITYSKPRGSCVLSITPLSLNFASGSYDLKTAEANTRLDTVLVPARENSHLQEIIPLVNASKEIENSIHVNWSLQVSRVDRQSSVQDFVVNPIRSLLCLILVLFSYAAEVFTTLGRSKFFLFRAVTFLFSLPVMFLQFSRRMQQARIIHKYINDKVDINSFLKKVNTTENRNPQSIGNPQKVLNTMESSNALKCTRQALSISHRNLVFSILFDVILGICMVFCLYFYNAATSMADGIIKTTELVADLVSRLIIWMMGIPAGLKLNKELANLLGQFFLYHIFLWKTYLAFLQPYVQSIVWFSILPGCCGFTFLLSLVSDVLSLLTLHIYCFYVYAARIYNLQVHYLLLLGRHFTG